MAELVDAGDHAQCSRHTGAFSVDDVLFTVEHRSYRAIEPECVIDSEFQNVLGDPVSIGWIRDDGPTTVPGCIP